MVGAGSDPQLAQWTRTFEARPDFLGAEPSEPGRAALQRFLAAGARDILELGPGQGRDTLLFVAAGLRVTALDFAAPGLEQIRAKADAGAAAGSVEAVVADVRERLPFPDAAFDAAYAHMLFCMALTTPEIERLAAEVGRVLRPGGLLVYTVRNTSDAHYRAGIEHGDERFEMGGFVVHFFDLALVERLAEGWELLEVSEHEEGRLPRRLFVVTMRRA
ncbi:MAG TPA: class I SAM-dependent methyltransferase [Candidatus Limnocylindrales bacterium]